MTRHEQAFALAAATIVFVGWLTLWPTLHRAIRARQIRRETQP